MSAEGSTKDFDTIIPASVREDDCKKTSVKKKRNPQTKLKTYFAPKTNSAGYPMKHCKYQPDEGDFMYQPPWYGQRYAQDPRSDGIRPVYCRHCKLCPCLAREHQHEMTSLGHHLDVYQNKQPHEIREALAYQLEMQRRLAFKLNCSAPMSQTQCVTDFVHFWYADVEDSGDEFSDHNDY